VEQFTQEALPAGEQAVAPVEEQAYQEQPLNQEQAEAESPVEQEQTLEEQPPAEDDDPFAL
jgi:hypothetical protein